MSRFGKIILSLIGLSVGAVVGGYLFAPFRLFALAAVGRSPACPMSKALKSAENLRQQVEYNDRIFKASRLVEKQPGSYQLWETPHGRFWIPDGNEYVLPYNLAELERRIYGTGEQAVRPGDIVLDCGAHVGTDTRAWVEAGARLVVAIEPAPENVECLRRNFQQEIAAGKVIVYPKGVWDKDDVLELHTDPHNSAADTLVIKRKDATGSVQVPLTTIDKLVAELKLERVDYIKMDIEGAEQRALRGAQETIAKFHPRLSLAAYHVPDDPQRIPELVRAAWAGYKMECGPCSEASGSVHPDVLYFR